MAWSPTCWPSLGSVTNAFNSVLLVRFGKLHLQCRRENCLHATRFRLMFQYQVQLFDHCVLSLLSSFDSGKDMTTASQLYFLAIKLHHKATVLSTGCPKIIWPNWKNTKTSMGCIWNKNAFAFCFETAEVYYIKLYFSNTSSAASYFSWKAVFHVLP